MTHYMTESANCTNNNTFLWQRLLREEYFRPGRAVKHINMKLWQALLCEKCIKVVERFKHFLVIPELCQSFWQDTNQSKNIMENL